MQDVDMHACAQHCSDYLLLLIVCQPLCSKVYDVVTALWKEVGNRYKNYVDFPKPNGYRSIHTTVQHQSGMLLEVQVHAVITTTSCSSIRRRCSFVD
jgi:ppGpp synthetase/RelA/SpoT-type nucleotidyltranferase